MARSMTAFSRVYKERAELEISWELKSVNHRYLDINLRLPEEYRQLEMKVREIIQSAIKRGKLEVLCRVSRRGGAQEILSLNSSRVEAVIEACNAIETAMGVGQAMSALDVLKFPGVMVENNEPGRADDDLLNTLADAIDEFQQNRQREGERMAAQIMERARSISDSVAAVRLRRVEVIESVQNRLRQRVAELSDKVDNDRLEQELVIIAQKMDVDEELDRIDSHVEELKHIFARDEPVGRRLDFLMQEFNREANTLGSKSADAETTQAAIDLKVLIEQMREQVQNIE